MAPHPLVGKPAPALQLPDQDGNNFDMADVLVGCCLVGALARLLTTSFCGQGKGTPVVVFLWVFCQLAIRVGGLNRLRVLKLPEGEHDRLHCK
jgi:hypothetical protein